MTFLFFFKRWLEYPWKSCEWALIISHAVVWVSWTWQLLVPLVRVKKYVSFIVNVVENFKAVKSVALLSTGGVLFTDDVISWHIPRRITPLIDGSFKIVEMHMGINGQRLDKSQMATRGYTLSAREFHIVIEIPIGSPDGYYKVGKCIN